MATEVKVPSFPESVADGTVVAWHRQAGDEVKRDDILVDIETDKVVFEVPAPVSGVLDKIVEQEGATVLSEQLLAVINEKASSGEPIEKTIPQQPAPSPVPTANEKNDAGAAISPSVRKMISEHGLDIQSITGTGKGGRILKDDVMQFIEKRSAIPAAETKKPGPVSVTTPVTEMSLDGRVEKRVPMTRLRARIAERLVEAQHNAAMLTTFNEVNMKPVMELRARYKDKFEKEYGARLGFMSFFVKAVVEALKKFPGVNASIDGNDIVYHGYYDIGIAVSSPRGLVVPVLRNTEHMSMGDIENSIIAYAQKAKDKTLGIDDITGGTFTITNGGVFGSMLSTPILNPPQSAILGMHKIQERAMVENGGVVVLPMMYLALSYDHRIVDGREAVQFLVAIKDMLEDPARIMLQV